MSYISMFDFPGTSVPRGLTPPMTPEQVAEFRRHYEARYLSPQLPPQQVADFRKHFDAQFPSPTSTSTTAVASAAAAAVVRSELSASSAPVAVATQPAKSEVQQPSSSVPATTNTQTDEVSAPPTRVEAEIKEVKSEIPSPPPAAAAAASASIAIDAPSCSATSTIIKVESVVEVKEAAPTSPTAAPTESVSNTNTDTAKTLTAPKPFVQVDTRANVVFLGNLEAGKTTLMGHLLTATNCLDKKPPSTKSEKKRAAAVAESKEQKLVNRQRNDIEKMHGQMQDVPLCVNHYRSVIDGPANPHCTIDFHVHLHPLRTANRVLTLIDVPGRRKYLRHLIAPLAAVDVAVLVVSVLDPMATSTSKLLTTHAVFQQLIAAYANGIRHILLVVNKIDTVKDADPKFIMNTINGIGYRVLECAKKIGFRCEIPVVPVSSFFGTNIFSKSPLMPWYTGPTLMEALDALPRPQRSTSKALRLCVLRTHQVEGQAVAFGALMSGRLHVGDTVEVLPERKQGKVLSIQHHRAHVESAHVGDLVGVVIQNVMRTNMNRGSLLHRPTDLKCCRSLTTFEADVHFFSNAPDVIRPGYSPPIYNAARNINPKLTRIEKRFQKGKEVDDLKMMKSNETALLRMEVGYRRSLPLDSFSASRRLGGLLIVDNHEIIGFGIIKFLHPFRDKCLASLMAASNNAWPKDLLHIVASYVPDDDVAKWVDSK